MHCCRFNWPTVCKHLQHVVAVCGGEFLTYLFKIFCRLKMNKRDMFIRTHIYTHMYVCSAALTGALADHVKWGAGSGLAAGLDSDSCIRATQRWKMWAALQISCLEQQQTKKSLFRTVNTRVEFKWFLVIKRRAGRIVVVMNCSQRKQILCTNVNRLRLPLSVNVHSQP